MSVADSPKPEWSLYLIRSGDGNLYTGISTDVKRRFGEHENKDKKNKGAKALRGKAPLSLAYQIVVGDRSEASKLEFKVKKLSKTLKEQLIDQQIDLEELQTWIHGSQAERT